jgi:hypothetical protein
MTLLFQSLFGNILRKIAHNNAVFHDVTKLHGLFHRILVRDGGVDLVILNLDQVFSGSVA